jgi:UPF0755 protein
MLRTLIIAFAILAVVAGWAIYKTMPSGGSAEKAFIVKKNENLSTISKNLEQQGFIKNRFLFKTYSTLTRRNEMIVEGEHTIKQGSDFKEILADLSTLNLETEGNEVIIPEGSTVIQIADSLSKQGIVNKRAFLKRAKTWKSLTKEQRESLQLKRERQNKGSKFAVEGLLFPDTYFFERQMDEKEVIRQMADRLIEKTENISINTGLTPYEWITLASIIEQEALLNKEKRKIAGVFMNRIRDGKKLQSCSTVQYLLNRPKVILRRKDLKIKSKYNTYLNEGLPPSPIASPDLSSLRAAADPEQHDYYYFVSKQDGTWSHYFSKTYKEHRKYTRLSGNY